MRARALAVARAAALRAEAGAILDRWQAERFGGDIPLWSPSIRCAIVAGRPWLDLYCPGCATARAIDLRELDRHPDASLASLVLGFRCRWCRGMAPLPRIVGLHARPPAAERKDAL